MDLKVALLEVRNYKSVVSARLPIDGIVALVGENGAGKSNLLDAFGFLADALRHDLDWAFTERGGVEAVRRWAKGPRPAISLAVELRGSGSTARFEVAIGVLEGGGYEVLFERGKVGEEEYRIRRGVLEGTRPFSARANPKDLFLRFLASEPGFDLLYRALTGIEVVDPDPRTFRSPGKLDPFPWLKGDGSNAPSLYFHLPREAWERVVGAMRTLVPGLEGIEGKSLGPAVTLLFKGKGFSHYASSASYGTLRLLALLVGAFHPEASLVAMDGPEKGLHPAAVRKLADLLLDLSQEKPLVIATHSAELLEALGAGARPFRVHFEKGATVASLETLVEAERGG